MATVLGGCYKAEETGNRNVKPAASNSASIDAAQIIDRYRSVDTSRDSVIKMRAAIQGSSSENPNGGTRTVSVTLYQKKQPDGRRSMLIEFTEPLEERDRDALVMTSPDGQVEGARYLQSNNSFISSTSTTDEDSLFGLTLQELVGGQPEKYDFTGIGEETIGSTPAYRLEGKLKPGAESRFAREVMLVSKQNYTLLMSEFYDTHNVLLRRLDVDRIEQVEGHWTRMSWTVTNHSRGKRIKFEVAGAKYDQNLSDSIFTREHLKKLASR